MALKGDDENAATVAAAAAAAAAGYRTWLTLCAISPSHHQLDRRDVKNFFPANLLFVRQRKVARKEGGDKAEEVHDLSHIFLRITFRSIIHLLHPTRFFFPLPSLLLLLLLAHLPPTDTPLLRSSITVLSFSFSPVLPPPPRFVCFSFSLCVYVE